MAKLEEILPQEVKGITFVSETKVWRLWIAREIQNSYQDDPLFFIRFYEIFKVQGKSHAILKPQGL